MSQPALQQPFSNLQLELLSLYTRNISEEELLQIRDMLAQFFAGRATRRANEIWEQNSLNAVEILQKHRRTPYRKSKP